MILPDHFLNKNDKEGEKGIGFLLLVVSIFLIGVALSAASEKWQTEARREKELELLFRGNQLLSAIEGYHKDNQAKPTPFPKDLKDLLYDDSGLNPKKYLRKKYKDPFASNGQWGLKRDKKTGGIVGVYSKSSQTPIKQAGFDEKYQSFKGSSSYSSWVFEYKKKENKEEKKSPADENSGDL